MDIDDPSIDLDLQPGTLVAVLAGNPAGIFFSECLLGAFPSGINLVLLSHEALPDGSATHRHLPVNESGLQQLTQMLDTSVTCPLGVVCGWPGLLPDSFIDRFHGRLLNVHAGDLPRYRGAGGGSWQVLNNEHAICADVQQMWPRVDAGPILLREHVDLPPHPYPADIKKAAAAGYRNVLKRLVELLLRGGHQKLHLQDQSLATYFPRLTTSANGWIDFSWSATMIERFVRAFSDPHAGASFRYENGIFRARRAEICGEPTEFHPFCTGLITNHAPGTIDIISHDGIVRLSDLRNVENMPVAGTHFRLGARCHSTAEDLLSARLHRPRSGLPKN